MTIEEEVEMSVNLDFFFLILPSLFLNNINKKKPKKQN